MVTDTAVCMLYALLLGISVWIQECLHSLVKRILHMDIQNCGSSSAVVEMPDEEFSLSDSIYQHS